MGLARAHFISQAPQAQILTLIQQRRRKNLILLLVAKMEGKEKWGIFYKGKVIPVGDETIRWIRQDPTEVWGWFKLELMITWKNMFLLTEISKRLGYLPLKDEAWSTTLNSWWRFLIDRPSVPTPLMISLGPLATGSNMLNSEKFLSEAEAERTKLVITVRKILQDKSVECSMMGNLHRVKNDSICRA